MKRMSGYARLYVSDMPFEANEITHSPDRKIRHEIHVSRVYISDQFLPVFYCSPMWIEEGKIECRITCIQRSQMHFD